MTLAPLNGPEKHFGVRIRNVIIFVHVPSDMFHFTISPIGSTWENGGPEYYSFSSLAAQNSSSVCIISHLFT